MDILIGVVTKIGGYIFAPVGHQLGYLFHYKKNVDNLRTKMEELGYAKLRLQNFINEARRKGEEIYADVEDWLSKVHEIVEEAENFLRDEGNANTECCSNRSFPNLVLLHRLSKKANKMVKVINEIQDIGRFDNVSYIPILQSNFDIKGYMTFGTRNSILMGIMAALEDSNISMVGVYGMAGVGKTTLVKEVARRVLEDKLFSDAVEVIVSQTPDHEKIQQEIADKLGLVFHEKSIQQRANRLRNRLRQETKFLIILDDVWKKLDLFDVGICFEDDQKGCKILLTSRFEDVLCNHMGVEKNFQVELLSKDEAWNWFNKIVGDSIENSDQIQHLAIQIVEECACLPIAIVTVSHALKNKSLPFWKDALRQLQRSTFIDIEGMNEKVYSSIKLSYDFLDSEEAKSLFLLCSLHEEDTNVNLKCLSMYGMGLGMFRDVYTMEEVRNRVHTLVDKLKARCLLMGSDDEYVTMHDVIHDVGITIASDDRNMYAIRSDVELEDCLNNGKLKHSTAISLLYQHVGCLPKRLECRQLQLIRISKSKFLQIPNQFFEEAEELRVVDLSNSCLKTLPSSFYNLQNLRTLCLRGCKLGGIDLIGELKNLEILDLSNSKVKELPKRVGQFTHLRLLDLTNCFRIKVIQQNVLSNLIHLEELYMKGSFSKWEVEDVYHVERRSSNVKLIELKNLAQLTTLCIEIRDVKVLPKDFFSERFFTEKLEGYKMLIGDYSWNYSGHETSRVLQMTNFTKSSLLEGHGLEKLLNRPEELYLYKLKGAKNVVYELDKEGFPQLKHLVVKINDEIQYIVDSMEHIQDSSITFQRLESLHIDTLTNLQQICHGKLTIESFSKLRVVKVSNSKKLKSMFLFYMVKSLSQLEEIKVTICHMMKEIVAHGIEDDVINIENGVIEQIEFPQLRSLRLKHAQKLTEFCSELNTTTNISQRKEELLIAESAIPFFKGESISFPKLEKLSLLECNCQILASSNCNFQTLRELYVLDCEFLKSLFSSSVAASLMQLNHLVVSNCKVLVEIITIDTRINTLSFPKLKFLKLDDLPNLIRFCSETFIEFPMMTNLNMSSCPHVKTFVSNSSPMNMKLEESQCSNASLYLFNERVAFSILKDMNIEYMDDLEMIWDHQLSTDSFYKLENITIRNCNNLMKIFPSSMLRRLQSLKTLEMWYCDKLEEVFEIQIPSNKEICNVASTSLSLLKLYGSTKLRHVWSKDPLGTFTLPNLQEFSCHDCPSLETLFQASLAKGLHQLEKLEIKNCGIHEIVTEEEEGLETLMQPKFVFPQLSELRLLKLPQLVCFYPKLHTTEWPLLKMLDVLGCWKVKIFVSEFSSFQKTPLLANHPIQQPLFLMGKVAFPNSEQIGVEESAAILSSRLNSNLISRASEHLETPQILDFGRLKAMEFFQNLTTLRVSKYNEMVSLLASSTAKTLQQLKKLSISDCHRMTEIIAEDEENNNDSEGEIVFNKLEVLALHSLPNLTSFFYSMNKILRFPKLEKVVVSECLQMQSFSHEAITPKLDALIIRIEERIWNQIYIEWHFDGICHVKPKKNLWKGDIDTTIRQLWESQLGISFQQLLTGKESSTYEEDFGEDHPVEEILKCSDYERDWRKCHGEDFDDEDISDEDSSGEEFDKDSEENYT